MENCGYGKEEARASNLNLQENQCYPDQKWIVAWTELVWKKTFEVRESSAFLTIGVQYSFQVALKISTRQQHLASFILTLNPLK